jgi:hypothetical protein
LGSGGTLKAGAFPVQACKDVPSFPEGENQTRSRHGGIRFKIDPVSRRQGIIAAFSPFKYLSLKTALEFFPFPGSYGKEVSGTFDHQTPH